jgi:hypothetical protein
MDAIYYISGTLMTLTIIGLIIATILFLIKPHYLQKSKHINKPVSRKVIFLVALGALFVALSGYGTVLAATEPASVKQARIDREKQDAQDKQALEDQRAKAAAEQAREQQEAANKPQVTTETKAESVPFESTEQQNNTLPAGQQQVSVEGKNGERTITYEVTRVQGKETARKEIKNEIMTVPVAKVTQIGTYVAPPPVQYTPPSQNSSNVRVGATCNDGSHSNATGSGACSHHGGVAFWLYG